MQVLIGGPIRGSFLPCPSVSWNLKLTDQPTNEQTNEKKRKEKKRKNSCRNANPCSFLSGKLRLRDYTRCLYYGLFFSFSFLLFTSQFGENIQRQRVVVAGCFCLAGSTFGGDAFPRLSVRWDETNSRDCCSYFRLLSLLRNSVLRRRRFLTETCGLRKVGRVDRLFRTMVVELVTEPRVVIGGTRKRWISRNERSIITRSVLNASGEEGRSPLVAIGEQIITACCNP